MTLPFRRRHNDAEVSHDRARAIIATGFLEPVDPSDADWLETHLADCRDCASDAAAWEADRQLLRAARMQAPEPPRDLWARTAAAIEGQSGQRNRAGRRTSVARGWRIGRLPGAVASTVLVVLVVVGASLMPRGPISLGPTPGNSDVAVASPGAEPTPIAVTAFSLGWVQSGPDGTYEYLQASIDQVCPDPKAGCATVDTSASTRLDLREAPQAVILSPSQSQIVVVTRSADVAASDVVVVPVPTAPPAPPTVEPATTTPSGTAPGTPTATPSAVPTPVVTVAPPPTDAAGSPLPSDGSDGSGHAIATGVIVVGDAAYSADGQWLAFSARPADGSSGPDLYVWKVGDALATQVTSDHRTFFADWVGDQILANRVEPGVPATQATPGPEASAGSADPAEAPSPSPSTATSPDPDATAAPTEPPVQDHPVAFLLDPATGTSTPLAATDIWHPTVDPTSQTVVYWSGTLVADGTGTGWALGTGRLVIDGWQDGTPQPTDAPSSKPTGAGHRTSAPDGSADPGATASSVLPTPSIGPAGHPITLDADPLQGFEAWFDPTGTRLALWVGDTSDPNVGTLRLVVLDPETRAIDPTADPLPGVAALRGVSINAGRLAWVTPPGQDGDGSHVQVLAWKGHDFGQVRTIQANRLFVAR